MKKLLSTLLLALITIAGWAQKEVVWENPSAFTGSGNIEFDITKMELKETETVMHFRVKFIPNYWIRFAKESFLKTPDGKEYAVVSGKKTSEAESDVELDSLFWMPESGLADLVLHFKPVPTDTKEIDFIEGYDEGAFRFFNICDKKTKKEPEWPAEWKGVKYAKDEMLPEAKIGKGVAKIKVKLLGYKPGMGMELRVGGFRPLGEKEYFDKSFPLVDDGTATAEIPLRMTREVSVGVSGVAGGPLVIAPGQEISLLMNIGEGNNRPLAIKGFLAKTNMDLNEEFVKLLPKDAQVIRYKALSQCDTPEKRLAWLKDEFDKKIAEVKASDYTTAAKDLLCMEAEGNFVEWSRFFGGNYTNLMMTTGKARITSQKDYSNLLRANDSLLVLSEAEKAYSYQYLDKPTSPCSDRFWTLPLSQLDKDFSARAPWLNELQTVYFMFSTDEKEWDGLMAQMKYEDCKGIVTDYQKEQERLAQELAQKESIFFKKFDDVKPENILQTILDRYKGKAVLIDMWATWCGPCRAGHKAMAPMKEQMKGQNVQFVYITSPSSPLSTWQEMIKEIDGDHYYLTPEQYSYILAKYESSGIPTYAVYNTQGEQTYKVIGFPGNEEIRKRLEEAMK
ncbi:MAG: TlpA family protein disulfide reductase [Prevotella sp.]|nr:TlpA family protein disulfide reductase [Prevotella sp.]